MRTRFTFFVAIAAMTLSACGGDLLDGGSEIVATVSDGDLYSVEITESQVEELSISNGVVPTEAFAQDLTNTIVELIVIERAESDYGISFTEDEIEERRAELQASVEGSGSSYEEFLETQGFTDARVRRIAHQQLVAEAVQDELVEEAGPVSDEEVDSFVAETIRGQTNACVSHILLETEEEAVEARQRVLDGEDFADVAMDVSTGPSGPDGGDLGCATLGSYVPEFAEGAAGAEIGVPTDPVRSSFGWHVILVTERTEPDTLSEDEVRSNAVEVLNSTRGQPLIEEWLLGVIAAADVTVEPEFGTWVAEPSPQILPQE